MNQNQLIKKLNKFRAPRVGILVDEKNIELGMRKNSKHCPIAESIKEQVNSAFAVSVDLQTIRWSDRTKGLRYVYLTPRAAQDFLVRFDRGMKLPPFKLFLRGAHVVTATYSDRGKKGLRKHKLGRRRLNPTKDDLTIGTVPETIGGRPVPRSKEAHKSHSSHRAYGMRAFTLDDIVSS